MAPLVRKTLWLSLPLFVSLGIAACGPAELSRAPGSGGGETATGGAGTGGTGADDFVGSGGAGGAGGQGAMGGEGGTVDTTGCGDGLIQPGEVCDDGNSDPGDGCAADCQAVEQDFACPNPGEPCVSTVVCGDGLVTGTETCDDGNVTAGDGCSDLCVLEMGWICPNPGAPCIAAMCGDGIIAGNEECEDDDAVPTSGDGCSDTCQREFGFECPGALMACYPTVCGDGLVEGDEPCDDGNDVVGDGCSPFCEVEPICTMNGCTSSCGDGMILPADNEQCDDGNTLDGDGCSSTCMVEGGFICNNTTGQLPQTLEVVVTYRDLITVPLGGNVKHPDVDVYSGSAETPGLVQNQLGPNGKPVYTGICEASLVGPCPYGQQTTSQADFDTWYNDTPGVTAKVVTKLALNVQPDGSYFFPDPSFFPLDGIGHVGNGDEASHSNGHNYGFTTEIRTWFEFQGGETLVFSGDDDVWVFVNGQLALDLGGMHPEVGGQFTLDAALATQLGLTAGNVYEIVLFHAERRPTGSNFNLTLAGFVTAKSTCEAICGDGIVAGDETCDDGVNDGSYGSCMPDCTPGPTCGDTIVQSPPEECDDGVNLATYSFTGMPGCAPGCTLGGFCGDATVQSLFGEECDDGTNAGGYDGCDSDCTFGPRCGDGTVDAQFGEQCDDGNTVSGDGCTSTCQTEAPK